jgi:hypothetical protein
VPLIASLENPTLARKSDEVLRRITSDQGPGQATTAAWQAWWQANQNQPLPREHGKLPAVLLGLLLLAAAVAGVILLQRKLLASRPPPLSIRAPVGAPPAPAPPAPAPDQPAPSGQ